jgi:hypothetical protein
MDVSAVLTERVGLTVRDQMGATPGTPRILSKRLRKTARVGAAAEDSRIARRITVGGERGVLVSHNPLVSRRARCRALAARAVKGAAWERRGNPFAALSVGSGAS